jgi:hypothetical protein
VEFSVTAVSTYGFNLIPMNHIFINILVNCIPVALMCVLALGFWRLWKSVCVSPQPRRDLPVLILIPFLSLVMLGVTWWNTPEKGSNWNIWAVAFPLLITVAMFSYSIYSVVNRRHRLLSFLGVLVSGLVTLLECGAATYVIIAMFDK